MLLPLRFWQENRRALADISVQVDNYSRVTAAVHLASLDECLL